MSDCWAVHAGDYDVLTFLHMTAGDEKTKMLVFGANIETGYLSQYVKETLEFEFNCQASDVTEYSFEPVRGVVKIGSMKKLFPNANLTR